MLFLKIHTTTKTCCLTCNNAWFEPIISSLLTLMSAPNYKKKFPCLLLRSSIQLWPAGRRLLGWAAPLDVACHGTLPCMTQNSVFSRVQLKATACLLRWLWSGFSLKHEAGNIFFCSRVYLSIPFLDYEGIVCKWMLISIQLHFA